MAANLSFAEVLDALAKWEGQTVGVLVSGHIRHPGSPHPIAMIVGELSGVAMSGAGDSKTAWSVAQYRIGESAFAIDSTAFGGAGWVFVGCLSIDAGGCVLAIECPPGPWADQLTKDDA
jgi:hypothetical protein